MENKKVLILGSGGHCLSVIQALSFCDYEIGIIEKEKIDKKIEYSKIKLYDLEKNLCNLKNEGWDSAFIAVGSIGNTCGRENLYKKLKNLGFKVINIIDKNSKPFMCKLGEGIFIGKNAVVNAGSIIGDMCIINTGAIVEHDCKIGNFVHVAPGAVVCGNCEIGENTHIGAGSVVIQNIKIGSNSFIGAGSVVVNNIPDNVIAFGNPCRVVKKNEKNNDNC